MNRTKYATLTVVFASQLLLIPTNAQQKPLAERQQHADHAHGDVKPLMTSLPRLGRSQERAGSPLMSLQQALEIAQENNPTLRQAEAEIRAAKARQQQSGLYANPVVGYTGDEIRGGSVGG